ncbi:hypothetical protein HNQ77_003669 [Silvibacterium bohemicum]|uniref:Uncharacterized protein n=1 Tax=Silvibacterium bohemicum TaxID=1577686 RepID=A0A841K526_9BACT|nr:hypothetical protein [Silvibacterium bohemicum]MBB6145708.1 hypothetical protein [Silvibacterium bohemicum]
MQNSKPLKRPFRDHARSSAAVNAILLLLCLAGCGTTTSPSTATAPASAAQPTGPQNYFAGSVAGNTGLSIYTFDDAPQSPVKMPSFSQTIGGVPPQILSAGTFSVSQRGLRSLSISTLYVENSSGNSLGLVPTSPTPGTGGFALELAGQAGGFVQVPVVLQNQTQLVQQPVTPLVAANACPNFSTAQTYQFLTIPAGVLPAGAMPATLGWDPTSETAFGSVDISTSGSTVNFKNIQQFLLPSASVNGSGPGGSAAPLQPPPSSLTGVCGPSAYGSTIEVPGTEVVTTPGVGGSGNNVDSPQATIGIGPSGLLVEGNGSNPQDILANSSPPLPYENALGAGTGAVGLPKPSAALDTGTVVGAQYLGFIYGAGQYTVPTPIVSSHLASFGFPPTQIGCTSVAPSTSTVIYGGDFPQLNGQDNPSAPPNCDFAIDLGSQDSSNAGLYPNAKVTVEGGYAANATGATDSFPAVAIAGQLNGKYAIFVIGEDSTQPWAIYLLQSN